MEDTDKKETVQYTFVQKLMSCAFYFLIGIAIFLAPFYIGLSRITSIPFFVCGGIILYASVVSFSIRLAEQAAGVSQWDRKGLITVTSLWSWGLLLMLGPTYFSIRAGWSAAFYIPAIIVPSYHQLIQLL